MRFLALLFLVSSCGYGDVVEPKPEMNPDEQMRTLYYERLEQANNWGGWPSEDDCDGLVWAGVAAASGVKLDLSRAFHSGQINRRPDVPCYPDDNNNDGRPDSRSTISNDGLVALMLGSYLSGNGEILKRMASIGEANNWVYGKPWPSGIAEVYLKPWFQGLLGRLNGGKTSYSKIPLTLQYSSEDYPAHIQTLAMIAESKVKGGLSSSNIELLKRYHHREPGDYLIRSVYGQYNGSVSKAFMLVQPPSYVRGGEPERFALVHWLLAAKIYLNL